MIDRQVPKLSYLLVGNGRVAKHMLHYFDLSLRENTHATNQYTFHRWRRNDSINKLKELTQCCDFIMLAISDDSIRDFIENYQIPREKIIHFSGSQSIDGAYQVHPLMTFSEKLYNLDFYEKIPFISSSLKFNLKKIFPFLSNEISFIPKNQVALYHSLCVLTGNGLQVLIAEALNTAIERLQLSKETFYPLIEQSLKNLKQQGPQATTGPWVRKDTITINKNIDALSNTNLQSTYQQLHQLYKIGMHHENSH